MLEKLAVGSELAGIDFEAEEEPATGIGSDVVLRGVCVSYGNQHCCQDFVWNLK